MSEYPADYVVECFNFAVAEQEIQIGRLQQVHVTKEGQQTIMDGIHRALERLYVPLSEEQADDLHAAEIDAFFRNAFGDMIGMNEEVLDGRDVDTPEG